MRAVADQQALRKQPVLRPTGRLQSLDALRGIAALMVLAFHYTYRFHQLYPSEPHVGVAFVWGQYGVDLFFVISGFVILMTLQSMERGRDFVVARFSRLVPAYWVAVCITFVAASSVGLPGRKVSIADAGLNLTMLQAYLGKRSVDGVYWTLAVELAFYAVMLAFFVSKALRPRALPWTAATWLVVSQVLASEEPKLHGSLRAGIDAVGLQYSHLFVAGMAIYALRTGGVGRVSRIGFVAMIGVAPVIEWYRFGASPAWFVVAFIAAVTCASSERLRGTNLGPIYWLGLISYPLYLLHQDLGYLLLRSLPFGPVANLGVTLLCVLLLASSVHLLVEVPALTHIRERYRFVSRARMGEPASRA